MPLLLAATGELVSERAGVLNMSLEGMMLIGAFGGAVGAWATGSPMIGLAIGVLAAVPVALLQAFLSITLRANQIVTGIGINILVLGGTTLGLPRDLRPPLAHRDPGAGQVVAAGLWATSRLRRSGVPPDLAAVCAAWCRSASDRLDAAPHRARPGAACRRRRAARGRQVRPVGDAVRYGAVLFTGVMAALAGCFLSIGDIHTFTEGMTNGAGYLAIAAVIFGNWKIGRTLLACLLFGAATALQFQLPAMGVQVPDALLIMLPYLLALLAVGGLVGRQTAPPYLTRAYVR